MSVTHVEPSRIYQARLNAGLSQADVAYRMRAAGTKATERSVRRWETGEHAPHANVLHALAAALGVTIDELYGERERDDEEGDPLAGLELLLRRLVRQVVSEGTA